MDKIVCPFCGREKSLRDPLLDRTLRCSHCGKFFRNPLLSSLNQYAEHLKKHKVEVKRKKVVESDGESNLLYGVFLVFGIIFSLFCLFYFGMKNELLGFLIFIITIPLSIVIPMIIDSHISSDSEEDDDMEGLTYQEMVDAKIKAIEREKSWSDVKEILGFLFLGLWKILKFVVIIFLSILTVSAYIVAGKKK